MSKVYDGSSEVWRLKPKVGSFLSSHETFRKLSSSPSKRKVVGSWLTDGLKVSETISRVSLPTKIRVLGRVPRHNVGILIMLFLFVECIFVLLVLNTFFKRIYIPAGTEPTVKQFFFSRLNHVLSTLGNIPMVILHYFLWQRKHKVQEQDSNHPDICSPHWVAW